MFYWMPDISKIFSRQTFVSSIIFVCVSDEPSQYVVRRHVEAENLESGHSQVISSL